MDNKLKKFSDSFEKVLKSYSKVQSPQNNISKLMKYVRSISMRTAKKSNLMEQAIKAENDHYLLHKFSYHIFYHRIGIYWL